MPWPLIKRNKAKIIFNKLSPTGKIIILLICLTSQLNWHPGIFSYRPNNIRIEIDFFQSLRKISETKNPEHRINILGAFA
ncbi:hypothetical protein DRI50_10240 [candidate division KSB1 bacterium]|nr:MAG: hypothetical protein DRI50_10240 [candidate division KSB1 bacterium]